MTDLLPVDEALTRILGAVSPLPGEPVALEHAFRRTLAEAVAARRTQPPFDVSAMDGYAVRSADLAPDVLLTIIGESPAGHAFRGKVGPGEAVRIFTGAPVPDGADTILIQENARPEGRTVRALQTEPTGRHIRRAGLDFAAGALLLAAGRRLDARDLALAAAMNHPTLPVHRRPRVAVLATGDELVLPGSPARDDQIVASNHYAVAALVEDAGGEPVILGIAADTLPALEDAIRKAAAGDADVLVTLGGASVGEHDLVRSALLKEGLDLAFWRIAMRPGKPMMCGHLGPMTVLGLPGNPVASMICSELFLRPLIRKLSGDPAPDADRTEPAFTAAALEANDVRQDYVRARIVGTRDFLPVVEAFPVQDSSMIAVMAAADCLVLRTPHAAPVASGEYCRIIRLRG